MSHTAPALLTPGGQTPPTAGQAQRAIPRPNRAGSAASTPTPAHRPRRSGGGCGSTASVAGRQASTPSRVIPTSQLVAAPQPTAADRLTGIARLAASAPREEGGKGVEYFRLPVRSVLNPVASSRVGFRWSINPYRGCEFGCHYCYARYTHEYMELDARQFENKIFVKDDAARLLRRELAAGKVLGEHIAIGAATDPYQPAERRFGLTRAILENLFEFARALPEPFAFDLSITTKSTLVLRDTDLLRELARCCRLYVNLSVTTVDPRLARCLEPRAPRPDLRLDTVRRLNLAGVPAGVFAAPILPGITDKADGLEALAAAAADARAAWFIANVVFLMPSSQKKFFPFIDEKFPRLRKQYRKWFLQSGYAPRAYREHVSRLVAELRARYNLAARGPDYGLPAGPARRPAVSPANYAALAAASRPQLAFPFAG